jgi:hypothetical protein
MEIREDIDPQGSDHKGFLDWYESRLRKFKRPMLVGTLLLLYGLVSVLLGISMVPSVYIVSQAFEWSSGMAVLPAMMIRGISLVMGYFVFGFTAIIVVPIANQIVLPYLKSYRGPYYSLNVFWWYLHNILTYSIRYSFLDWITPTPFNIFFFKRMGMKIGDHSEVNTTNISDPGLITIEEGVTIGGSATIIAHYAVRGYLIVSPVRIAKNATIGLRAIVMGGAVIGEGAKILPNSVILPNTQVLAGETWAGVPAKKVD